MTDLYDFKWISDPRMSPDGLRVAYVIKTVDENDRDKYRSQIWVSDLVTGESFPFTSGNSSDTSPRWSPDRKTLAFISNRSGSNQVWLMPASGGEAYQLTSFGRPLANIQWSPDSQKLAATAKIGPSDTEVDATKSRKSDVKVITRLQYKLNGEGFFGDRRTHIFLIDSCSGEVSQLTTGDHDHGHPTWSPDGTVVAFSGKRYCDADRKSYSDLYSVRIGQGEIKQLTESFGPCSSPVFSPNGETIAFYAHENEYNRASLTGIYTIPSEGGKATTLLKGFDRSVGNMVKGDMVTTVDPGPIWSEDAGYIYFTATDHGRTHVYEVSSNGDLPRTVTTGERVIYGFSLQRNTLVYCVTDPGNIGDLYVASRDGCDERQLTRVNDEILSDIMISLPERHQFVGANGQAVEGWMLRPTTFEEGKCYPLILEIHGGPHVAYGYCFTHEFQVLAGSGYVVLYTNPHGSQGYGQTFNAASYQDWGGKDYQDLMATADEISKFDYVDTDRMGVTGGSYGGFMTNWIIGQTKRFRAAVAERSSCNRYSMFGTSDLGFLNGEFEFKGEPWDNSSFYLERSPITYVRNIETPLLLIHSELDYRCPMEQAEQMYTALRWLGKEAMLVRFPDENHELSRSGKPRHRVERLQFICDWFDSHIKHY